jgi:dTDP-4-amino-4,6-dideoxygalactose transaminase
MLKHHIPYNKPFVTGNEFAFIQEAIGAGRLSGNGKFTKNCQQWLEDTIGCRRAFLVHSGTAALELGALLLDLQAGDEVIMPSFTFVTTATAVVLRGATPVFVDIRPDTLNIDEEAVARAITSKTKAIMPVHYAGVGCEMRRLVQIAADHGLSIFEDAAHAVCADYDGQRLGTYGKIAALSFHETKNLTCGEGGALLINDESLIERAEILVEKGTDRTRFFLGLTDKYTWRDVGSSFLCSEIEAAFLWAQMEQAEQLTQRRMDIWSFYHEALEPLEEAGYLQRPVVPPAARHNAHLYYVILNDRITRDRLLEYLNERNINAVFHYVPLHDSPAGEKFGRVDGTMSVTNDMSGRLLRLPLWIGLAQENVLQEIVSTVHSFFSGSDSPNQDLVKAASGLS